MKKIAIIGSAGSGKSTLAAHLGDATGIKVIHLDKLYWKPGWVEPQKEDWNQTVVKILEGDAWIIDGNYGGTMERRLAASDTIVFLDLPRTLCVLRVLKRVLKYKRNGRPDMADGCKEQFDRAFLTWVWNYPKDSKPKVESLLKRFETEKTIFRLCSRKAVRAFILRLYGS
jgi:Adenylate kinase and related kinases